MSWVSPGNLLVTEVMVDPRMTAFTLIDSKFIEGKAVFDREPKSLSQVLALEENDLR
jgi:hypothetical protein